MEKRVTIKDIARKMNVSLSTVNKALSGKPGISEMKRKEILEVCHKMGYVSNNIAQSLARNPITVGVVVPDMWQEYFKEIIAGMNAEFLRLEKYRIRPSFYHISEMDNIDDGSLKKWIIDNEIKVVILCSSAHSSALKVEEVLKKTKIPVFQVGDEQKIENAISVVASDVAFAGRLAADFLLCTQEKEIKAAALVGFFNIAPHMEKAEAFKNRITASGAEFLTVLETKDDKKIATECMEKLFCDFPFANAIYVATAMSGPVCKYLEENNLSGKVTVIGTDMFDELKKYLKNGTMKATIFQEQEEIGKTVVKNVYTYLIQNQSFGIEKEEIKKRILIKPNLYLKTNIE